MTCIHLFWSGERKINNHRWCPVLQPVIRTSAFIPVDTTLCAHVKNQDRNREMLIDICLKTNFKWINLFCTRCTTNVQQREHCLCVVNVPLQ